MELQEIRSKTRSIFLAIIAILVFILFLRISLELVGADTENIFVDAVIQVTDFLIAPTKGAVVLDANSELAPFNFDALIAIVFYLIGGLIFIELITSFMYDRAEDIVQNLVDAFFKVLEFILFLKIIFVLFEVGIPRSSAPWTVDLIYDLTSWTEIFPNPNFVYENIDWPTIVVLIIVVFFDIISEQFLAALFHRGDGSGRTVTHKTVVHGPAPQPAQQNITINVPAGQTPSPFQAAPQPARQDITVNVPQQPQR